MIDNCGRNAWLFIVREVKVPEKGAKRKLLDAAERLILEKGFESVSVRDVTSEVKANVAAVNYHFGSREGLLDMVMLQVLEPVCQERVNALRLLEQRRSGKKVSVEDLIDSYVDSLLKAAAGARGSARDYLRLVGKTLVLPDSMIAPVIVEKRRDVSESYFAALVKVDGSKSEEELVITWGFFQAGLNQSLQSISPASDLSKTLGTWKSFGSKGFSGVPVEKVGQEDLQGSLFDF